MSDPRQARPGAAPRPPPVPAGKPQAPRAPSPAKPVSPRPPNVRPGSQPDLPPSDDWEYAPTATSMPDDRPAPPAPPPAPREATAARRAVDDRDDRVETPRNLPPVEASPQSITKVMPEPVAQAARGAAAAALANAAPAGMSAAMREEVWTIVRAAVDQAIAPIVTRQKELEAKLAAAQAAPPPTLASRAQQPSTATARLASIPVQMGSVPPAPVIVPKAETAPGSSTIPDMRAPAPSQSIRPKGSPEGYGVSVTPSMRPSLDLEGITVGKDEIAAFDGGRKKKRVVKIVAVLMLLIAIAAVTLTILSQSGNSPL